METTQYIGKDVANCIDAATKQRKWCQDCSPEQREKCDEVIKSARHDDTNNGN